MKRVLVVVSALLVPLLLGCPKEPETATSCVAKIGKDACPVGADLDMNATSSQECGGKVDGSLLMQSGRVEAMCRSVGGCSFKCVPRPDVCRCGVKKLTVDSLECAACAASPAPASSG